MRERGQDFPVFPIDHALLEEGKEREKKEEEEEEKEKEAGEEKK